MLKTNFQCLQTLENGVRNECLIAVGRNNWTFAGSDAGGRRAAAIYTLIETAKLNDVDPQAWLADVLARLQDHPARRIAELLPWNWKLLQQPQQRAAA
jgi:transposase